MNKLKLHFFLISISFLGFGHGANILGLFPMPSMSHVRLGLELTKELAKRGHNITMITPYPQGINTPNYREISQEGLNILMQEDKKLFFEWEDITPFAQVLMCYNLGYNVTKYTFENPEIQKLLKSNATFDLVLMDQFYSEPLMGIAYHFKAPVILSSSLESASWTHHMVGNPEQWAFMPHAYLTTMSEMNFFERLENFVLHVKEEIYRRFIAYPYNNELLHHYMPEAPHLYDLMYNVSLIFVNSHHSYAPPTARMPNLIPFGGFHVKTSKGTIKKELKELLDGSKEGVIYFAMGSNLMSSTLPTKKREAFVRVFAKLKQKVLWKFETEDLPGKPKNLIISKWWPQHDILSHPNTKVFISHGGLMSTIEATSLAVPVLGIPIYCDQTMNLKRIRNNGHGLIVHYDDINEENLYEALQNLLQNKSYKENALKMSRIMKDRPIEAMEEAIFWVEYVIRHKGAPFLKSAAMKLNWFQQNCFDIYGFLLLGFTLSLFVIYKIIRITFCRSKISVRKSKIS